MPASDALPDLSGLLELSRIEHLDLKPVILRVQTDLFLRTAHRDRAALETFEALACGLIPTVDEETARIVAEKLAPHPDSPRAVLEALAARGGAPHAALVAAGVAVDDASGAEEAPLPALLTARLAALPGLRREAIEDLTQDGRPEVDRALAANHGIALRGAHLARVVHRARGEADLARLILCRPDATASDLIPLFLHADPIRREAIVRTVEATAALRPCPPPPRGLGAALTALSADRDVPAFIVALAESLGLPADFIATVAEPDARYDLLGLAMRAAGLHEEEAVCVFLTLNHGVARSRNRVSALVALFRAVSRPAARDLLSAVLDAPVAERTADLHQPYHGPEAKLRHGAERAAPQRTGLPARVQREAN
jgi:hypothetical protein